MIGIMRVCGGKIEIGSDIEIFVGLIDKESQPRRVQLGVRVGREILPSRSYAVGDQVNLNSYEGVSVKVNRISRDVAKVGFSIVVPDGMPVSKPEPRPGDGIPTKRTA